MPKPVVFVPLDVDDLDALIALIRRHNARGRSPVYCPEGLQDKLQEATGQLCDA